MKQNDMPVVKSAIRAIEVLEFIAASDPAPTFAQIGSSLGIPNSSLFYLLNSLSQRGYLRQNGAKGTYALGPALVLLANSVSRVSWTQIIEPIVQSVWEELKETTSYFEQRGNEMECLICKLAEHSLIPIHKVGQRSPLYVFSGGKIILAEMPKAEFELYLSQTPLKKLTPNTLSTAAAVRKEVAEVRRNGYAISREEHSLGTIGISVGLRNRHGLIGTLGVAIPAVRFDEVIFKRVRSTLGKASKKFLEASPIARASEMEIA